MTRSDIEIAQAADPRPISEIAEELDLASSEIEPHGRHIAKIPLETLERARARGSGRLVLVTGMNPTPRGEGKSTVSVGLADALRLRGKGAVLCLREPSLGPVFGLKGGAAGGGWSQVLPMEDINLHFTGDSHAVGSAHALLSALVDNHLHRGHSPSPRPARVTWPRAVDMNDRALRNVVVGLGGVSGGVPREDRFVITAASEVMAVFCLATDYDDLTRRLGGIIVGYDGQDGPVFARDLEAEGGMAVLLQRAVAPNLVQTLERTPALVHGGPFGNIAHGCNSLIATRGALALGEIVVTEAGFGSDLGAEKFFDIKARVGGLEPDAAVIVATVRALKHHGGAPADGLETPDEQAVARGFDNLAKHVENVRRFGVPPIVVLNRFASDRDGEIAVVLERCREVDVPVAISDSFRRGGEGALEAADAVLSVLEGREARFEPLYPLDRSLPEKAETVARKMYGASGVDFTPPARRALRSLEGMGLGDLPVCMAKTPFSFSDDPRLLGRPDGFRITVRDVTPSAGAGFVTMTTGDIMVMPGLPPRPASAGMGVSSSGRITGLS